MNVLCLGRHSVRVQLWTSLLVPRLPGRQLHNLKKDRDTHTRACGRLNVRATTDCTLGSCHHMLHPQRLICWGRDRAACSACSCLHYKVSICCTNVSSLVNTYNCFSQLINGYCTHIHTCCSVFNRPITTAFLVPQGRTLLYFRATKQVALNDSMFSLSHQMYYLVLNANAYPSKPSARF